MQLLPAIFVLMVAAHLCSALTKTPGASGISQFWTGDYKVFEQVYGKTSDKELYGDTLPASVTYDADATLHRTQASEKKERYIDQDGYDSGLHDDAGAHSFGNRYNNLLAKQSLKQLDNIKPTKTSIRYLSSDYKPITKSSDPETYKYLKHLEKLEKQKTEYPDPIAGGFKPYVNYVGPNPEDDGDGYKSIQDILDAHEANKGNVKGNEEIDEQVKYITYPPKTRGRNKKQGFRTPGSDKSKARCPSGRCRKRATNSYRVYTRPYVRRIKHKIVY